MKIRFFSPKRIMALALFLSFLIIGICIFHFSPAKWYFRQDCLCGRAYFHPGESYAPDEMLFQEIGQQELSDGVVRMLGTNCERHKVHIWITIWGTTSYSVRGPEN